jgi:hypothetical protein
MYIDEMKTRHIWAYRSAFTMAILCTGFLLYNMTAIPIFKKQVFFERGMIATGKEMAILIGFIFIAGFNIVSVFWVSTCIRQAQLYRKGDTLTLALGGFCLILLMGEKVMIDEIGREYLLGWEVFGEWFILYLFLAVQLLYNIVILQRLYRAREAQRSEIGESSR